MYPVNSHPMFGALITVYLKKSLMVQGQAPNTCIDKRLFASEIFILFTINLLEESRSVSCIMALLLI